MLVTRAVFLRIFGMAVAGARIDPIAFASRPGFEAAGPSQFQPLVGETFTVFPGDGSPVARVRLAEIVEHPPSKHFTQFSLIFHATTRQPLADGIHEFRHPALGSLSIFSSSIGAPAAGSRVYQACFSFMRT